jgi:hypothetical protein
MRRLLGDLRRMAIQFCESHDETCCTRKFMKHYHFQANIILIL